MGVIYYVTEAHSYLKECASIQSITSLVYKSAKPTLYSSPIDSRYSLQKRL